MAHKLPRVYRWPSPPVFRAAHVYDAPLCFRQWTIWSRNWNKRISRAPPPSRSPRTITRSSCELWRLVALKRRPVLSTCSFFPLILFLLVCSPLDDSTTSICNDPAVRPGRKVAVQPTVQLVSASGSRSVGYLLTAIRLLWNAKFVFAKWTLARGIDQRDTDALGLNLAPAALMCAN